MHKVRIAQEATDLWTVVFGEPPPVHEDGSLMLKMILESLPPVGYDRFAPNWRRPDDATRDLRARRR